MSVVKREEPCAHKQRCGDGKKSFAVHGLTGRESWRRHSPQLGKENRDHNEHGGEPQQHGAEHGRLSAALFTTPSLIEAIRYEQNGRAEKIGPLET